MRTQKRRRHESKTDYKKRLGLLKGKLPRIVFRKTNKYLISQYVTHFQAQDKTELMVCSKSLKEFGFENKQSLKSIPAAYFLGRIIGRKIVEKKMERPILDIGMHRAIQKSKIFAFIKGLNDSSCVIKCDEKMYPEEDRIQGKDLKEKINFKEILKKIEK